MYLHYRLYFVVKIILFNVKEDAVNYIEYNIMKQEGEKCNLRLKKGVVPHIFLCQKRNMPPPVERMAVVKRQRQALVNETLSEYAIKSSNILEIGEPPQRSDNEASPSTSHTNVCDINQAGSSTSRIEVCDDYQIDPCTSYIEDKLQSDKADRGFKDLSCLLQAKKCTLIRPPSVSKSTPSTKDEVKLSKQIAALRIHVERVINRLREFHMLLPHACVDHNLIPIIDHVLIIACGLVNMQDVLIKK